MNTGSSPPKKQVPAADSTPEQIAALAYRLYLRDGCPSGSEVDYWFRAEKMLAKQIRQTITAPERPDSRSPRRAAGTRARAARSPRL